MFEPAQSFSDLLYSGGIWIDPNTAEVIHVGPVTGEERGRSALIIKGVIHATEANIRAGARKAGFRPGAQRTEEAVAAVGKLGLHGHVDYYDMNSDERFAAMRGYRWAYSYAGMYGAPDAAFLMVDPDTYSERSALELGRLLMVNTSNVVWMTEGSRSVWRALTRNWGILGPREYGGSEGLFEGELEF